MPRSADRCRGPRRSGRPTGGFEALAAAGIIIHVCGDGRLPSRPFWRRAGEFPPRLRVLVGGRASDIRRRLPQCPAHSSASKPRRSIALLRRRHHAADADNFHPCPAWPEQHRRLAFQSAVQRISVIPPSRCLAGIAKSGLPIGMQAVAAHASRRPALRVRQAVSRTLGWHGTARPNKFGSHLD